MRHLFVQRHSTQFLRKDWSWRFSFLFSYRMYSCFALYIHSGKEKLMLEVRMRLMLVIFFISRWPMEMRRFPTGKNGLQHSSRTPRSPNDHSCPVNMICMLTIELLLYSVSSNARACLHAIICTFQVSWNIVNECCIWWCIYVYIQQPHVLKV